MDISTIKAFTGVGARKTPDDICELMSAVAYELCLQGWTLRSGGADGADKAFQRGARKAAEMGQSHVADVFLPSPGWNGNQSFDGVQTYVPVGGRYSEIAAEEHPVYGRLSPFVQNLQDRNVAQVIGPRLEEGVAQRSAMLYCWTPDGAVESTSRSTGGTGQAIRIAARFGVPVYNLKREDHRARVQKMVENFRLEREDRGIEPPDREIPEPKYYNR